MKVVHIFLLRQEKSISILDLNDRTLAISPHHYSFLRSRESLATAAFDQTIHRWDLLSMGSVENSMRISSLLDSTFKKCLNCDLKVPTRQSIKWD